MCGEVSNNNNNNNWKVQATSVFRGAQGENGGSGCLPPPRRQLLLLCTHSRVLLLFSIDCQMSLTRVCQAVFFRRRFRWFSFFFCIFCFHFLQWGVDYVYAACDVRLKVIIHGVWNGENGGRRGRKVYKGDTKD